MRTLKLIAHLNDKQLKDQLTATLGKAEFARWQILYLIQVGKVDRAETITPIVSLSRSSIYKIVEEYNKQGISSIKYTPKGGRHRYLLSLEEEAALLRKIEQEASKGLIKTANDIRALVEAKVGKGVSDDYLWDLLKRNGWKKKMPRPHHPKRNQAEQQEYKKNSPSVWHPSSGL